MFTEQTTTSPSLNPDFATSLTSVGCPRTLSILVLPTLILTVVDNLPSCHSTFKSLFHFPPTSLRPLQLLTTRKVFPSLETRYPELDLFSSRRERFFASPFLYPLSPHSAVQCKIASPLLEPKREVYPSPFFPASPFFSPPCTLVRSALLEPRIPIPSLFSSSPFVRFWPQSCSSRYLLGPASLCCYQSSLHRSLL